MVRLTAVLRLPPLLASAQEAFQLPAGNIARRAAEGRMRRDILAFSCRRPLRLRLS